MQHQLLLQGKLFTAPELQATAGSSAGAKHPNIRFDSQKEFASSIELRAAATWTDATPVVSLLHSSCSTAKNSFFFLRKKQINIEIAYTPHKVFQEFFMHVCDLL